MYEFHCLRVDLCVEILDRKREGGREGGRGEGGRGGGREGEREREERESSMHMIPHVYVSLVLVVNLCKEGHLSH